jgi:Initiator Replication protein
MSRFVMMGVRILFSSFVIFRGLGRPEVDLFIMKCFSSMRKARLRSGIVSQIPFSDMSKTSSKGSPRKTGRLKPKPRIPRPSSVENMIPPPSSVAENREEENEGHGILESFSKLPRTERDLIRQLLEKFDEDGVGVLTFPIPYGHSRLESKERRQFLLPIYRLIRYHRLNFDSIVDGAVRSTYAPWVESITTIKSGRREELELRLNGNYATIWRTLKESLGNIEVRLKSQYSSRLYQWAKQNVKVGFRRVSLAQLRKILGLEDIRDESGNLVQEAPLESWANVKQRALDHALNEINERSDVEMTVEFTGRGNYRKVNSLGFRITAKKNFTAEGKRA